MCCRIRWLVRPLDGSFLVSLGASSSDLGSGGFSSLFSLVDVIDDVLGLTLDLDVRFASARAGDAVLRGG